MFPWGAFIIILMLVVISLEFFFYFKYYRPKNIVSVVSSGPGPGSGVSNVRKCSAPGGSLGFDGTNWSCSCKAGWSGDDCSTYNGLGSTSLGLNMPKCYAPGGSLSNDGTTLTCHCAPGYSGVGCETFDPTKVPINIGNPPICAAPGGSLGFDGTKWTCVCSLGYYGDRCDLESGDATIRCLKGVKQYDNVSGVFKCNCISGWTGCDCSLPTDPLPSIGAIIGTCF